MNSEKNPIVIMQLGIKFNKLKEEINMQETNQKLIRKLY